MGNVIVPDILKASGPLNNRYVISMFMKNPKMCLFLNKHFNHMGLWYLDKETLFKFLKNAVIDFKVRRGELYFMKFQRPKEKLIEELEKKFPLLKYDDIHLLSELIENSPQKDAIYNSFGLTKPTKRKIKKEKNTRKTDKKTTAKHFIKQNFEFVER